VESEPPAELRLEGRSRVIVLAVVPELDAGAYPVKRVTGDRFAVSADLIADGHDVIAGVLLVRHESESAWREIPLAYTKETDRWHGELTLDRLGRWSYTVEGWVDHGATWLHHLHLKAEAGAATAADLPVELLIGAELCAATARRAREIADRKRLEQAASALGDKRTPVATRVELAFAGDLAALLSRHPDRALAGRYPRVLEVVVDRPRARFSTWYELFPRSTAGPGEHGTFRTAEKLLPYVQDMGFDVLYLPPIHPIGRAFRKGKNNTLTPTPDDVGSPWAVGGPEGGHTAIHPQLGTVADFQHFIAAARDHGLEIAMDIAFQASPDHPWVKSHPDWFRARPDGTIQYAENPPKKYQDIYPLDFESADWRGLWNELLSVFLHWCDQGVKIFRVDNPHTKSLHFWGWCIGEIKKRHPDAIFLAEAFTRPKLMYALAKLGFTQSYTYFTWREGSWDLRAYLEELVQPPVSEFFRPNFWPNTPDILPDHLMHAQRGAFAQRFLLAATLTASYGIYGPAYELLENIPRPGSGEYIDNEKYELRQWDLERRDSLRPLIRRINKIRRDHHALHDNRFLRFHPCDNPALLCYSKRTEDRSDVLLMAVNLDRWNRHGGHVDLDLTELGVAGGPFRVHDLIGGGRYTWSGSRNYLELDPHSLPAHIFTIEPT
jgi:starch synthase (maltosyl-transferring)